METLWKENPFLTHFVSSIVINLKKGRQLSKYNILTGNIGDSNCELFENKNPHEISPQNILSSKEA